MSERVEIASLNIDVKDFIKSASTAKGELEKLRKENQELRKSAKAGEISQEEFGRKFTKNDIRIKELSKTYRQNTQAAIALDKATKDSAEALNFEGKSVQEVTNQRANFIKVSKQIKGDTEAEREQREKLNNIIDEQTNFIRENSSEYADNKDRIGEYRDAINSSILGNTKFGRALKTTLDGLQEVKNVTKQATASTKAQTKADKDLGKSQGIVRNALITTNGALKLFRIALISTGVGAIVVALGSLIAFLSTTQEGVDAVTRVTKPLQEIFKSLLGVLQDLGKQLFDAITQPKQAWEDFQETLDKGRKFVIDSVINPLIAQFQNFVLGFEKGIKKARIAWNEFTGDSETAELLKGELDEINEKIAENEEIIRKGAENIANAYKRASENIKNFLEENIDRGRAIDDLEIEIEQLETTLRLEQSRLRIQIEAEREKRKDQRLTAEEREAAAQREIELTEQLSGLETEILDKKIAKANLEAEANDTSREDQKEINDLIAQREEIEARNIKDRTRIFQSVRSEQRKAEAERIKAIEEENKKLIEQQQKQLELFELRNKNSLSELELAEEVSTRRLEILEQEFEKGLKSELDYQIERLKIQQDFAELQNEIALEEVEQSLDRQLQQIEREIINEQERNERLAEIERERQQQRLEAGKISEQEFNEAINEINENERLKREELEAEREQINQENRLATLRLNAVEELQLRKELLEEQRQLEISEAEKTGADVTAINEKFAQAQKDIDAAIVSQKLDNANQIADIAKNAAGDNTAFAKIAGLAQAGINLGQAISQANTVPFPANAIAIGQAIATGTQAIRQIKQTKTPRAERGMRIGGRSHAQGGTMIEAEQGEAIVTKKAMASPLGSVVSAINESFGGVPLARDGMRVGMGASSRVQNQIINMNELEQRFSNALKNMKAPQVSVTEIREENDNFVEVIERANI